MNVFEKVIYFLQGEMPTPTNYSLFHIISMLLIVGLTVFLCIKFKDCSNKTFRKILLIAWIVMVVFEIYKQIVFSFNWDGNQVVWDYQWYAFPFQMCSTIMYVLPFILFMKDGVVKDACMAYLCTFSLFAGITVFFYPNDVFISMIGINIQTMVHHGMQVVLGIFLLVYNRHRLNWKYYLKGIVVFLIMLTIANVLNIILNPKVMSESFNMFYVSPYRDCTLPILSMIYEKTPYIVFLLCYAIGMLLAGALVYLVAWGIMILASRKKHFVDNKYQTQK